MASSTLKRCAYTHTGSPTTRLHHAYGLWVAVWQTLPSKRSKDQKERIEMSECQGDAFEKPPAQPASIRYLLSIPLVRALCISGAGLSFM